MISTNSAMSRWCFRSILALTLCLSASPLLAQRELKDIPDPDPELEHKSFIVADGFEVNLWAADPGMAKPIQMNFDAQGRLWIASSEVYPHIQPGQKPTDKILVIEDTNFDGKADKTTVFADGLLIPTGVIPDHVGGCYVANSTELLHFADTDGDGKADQKRIVLSGFGTEDTHHLLHTLRWGPDGCLYMNQSIYIHSHVETPYGVKRLNGGGIWRFRPETLELEVLCYGFVNSWGHHFDRFGQSFATDGAYGEGINYVFPGSRFFTAVDATRVVQGLNPGSPKLCGLEIVGGRHLPPEWDGNMITCDFRAHRVCRFVISEDGSGYASRQETELIKTNHVAFRPIDVKMGPDGAIYIADWYNPIIQHGEVDFRDERRDHTHGRIWRVTAKGRPTLDTRIAADEPTEKLIQRLAAPEEWTRQNGKLLLRARSMYEVDIKLDEWIASLDPTDPGHVHRLLEALWTQESRFLHPELVAKLWQSKDHRIRAAVIRYVSHRPHLELNPERYLSQAVADAHPRVRLEAVRALTRIPSAESAATAMQALDRPMDRFLDFALWQTMRDLAPHWLPLVKEGKFDFGGNVDHLVFALKAVDSPEVAAPLLALVKGGKIPADRVDSVLALIASLGNRDELGAILDLVVGEDSQIALAKRAALVDLLVETARLRKLQPSGDLNRLVSLLVSEDDGLKSAAARAAGAWKIEAARGKLAAWAADEGAPLPVRSAAIGGLASLGGSQSSEALTKLSASAKSLEARQQAIGALGTLDLQQAAQLTVQLLADAPQGLDPAASVTPLLARQRGTEALTAALTQARLTADVAKLVLRAVRSAPQPSEELIAAVQKAGGLEAAVWKLTPELSATLVQEVKTTGNPVRGEIIYRDKNLQCLKCHAIGGAGGTVGPDLVSIGASAPIDYLIESLLTPNSKIKEGYHSKVVQDQDGNVYTGIVVRQGGGQLVLRNAEDALVTIAEDNIAQAKDGRSLMPDGAGDTLTRQELVDLVRFLSELGKVGGNYTIGQARVVRRWQVLSWTKEAHELLNRTSYDSAATDNPALIWDSAYSLVSGTLPMYGLPAFVPHQGEEPTTFLRCQLDVGTPGPVKLKFAHGAKLALWIDGKPTPITKNEAFVELSSGRRTLTLASSSPARTIDIRLELADVPGSRAQVQIVGGK
jgi:putative heme-binding domain-containing protein